MEFSAQEQLARARSRKCHIEPVSDSGDDFGDGVPVDCSAHACVSHFDDVVDLDEQPDESGFGCGFSFRDPEGNVWDVAYKYGAELDERGGYVYP